MCPNARAKPLDEPIIFVLFLLKTNLDQLGGTEQVEAQLTDKELLRQFQEVEKLEPEDKHLVKTFIDAFITKRQIQRLAR